MRTDMEKLRSKMAEKKIGAEAMSKELGIDPSTFFRKMKSEGENFTVGQMHKIVEVLGMDPEEATDVFLLKNSQ